jgi:carboxylate-amine ligase
MADDPEPFTVGVEEEFFLVDAGSRALAPGAGEVLARASQPAGEQVEPELHRTQVEAATAVCGTLAGLRAELRRLRHELAGAAASAGLRLAASGTHPFSGWQDSAITPKEAYLRLARDYQQVAREQLVCGCHVHVGVPDPEEAIAVMNRVRQWLPAILALSVNSPFWHSVDTGYASFRTELWRRWPTAGSPGPFASRAEYDALLGALTATAAIDAPARVYWDVRPSASFPTLEFRVTDVCLTVDEAVLVAGLVRAVTETCHAQLRSGTPVRLPRPELLTPATWRAARFGLDGTLVDLEALASRPARAVVDALLAFAGPALAARGEEAEIRRLVEQVFAGGTGAARQRAAFARRGQLEDVVDAVTAETLG